MIDVSVIHWFFYGCTHQRGLSTAYRVQSSDLEEEMVVGLSFLSLVIVSPVLL